MRAAPGEFVAVLGVNALTLGHLKRPTGNFERDVARGDKVHLDPSHSVVPARLVAHGVERDRTAEFAIDPARKIVVEFRRHAARIVIGGFEHVRILHQIHPDQQHGLNPVIGLQGRPHRAQQIDRSARDHVADGRSGEKAELGQAVHRTGKIDLAHEIGLDRIDRQTRKLGREIVRRLAQEIARDIERDVSRRVDRVEQ